MMSAYSAVSFGHGHPRSSRRWMRRRSARGHVARLLQRLAAAPAGAAAEITGQDLALPVNTGAEAVETALKAARKWG